MEYHFRRAEISDIPDIWAILQEAIVRRKTDGSNQWQDGYPNPQVITIDVEKGYGHVLVHQQQTIGYCAIAINDEPAYSKIEGSWLTAFDFVVFHRLAIATEYLGKNLSQRIIGFITDFASNHNIKSLKADTNFDNFAMIKIFEKSGFKFCGFVYFRGSQRRAYEKVLY